MNEKLVVDFSKTSEPPEDTTVLIELFPPPSPSAFRFVAQRPLRPLRDMYGKKIVVSPVDI